MGTRVLKVSPELLTSIFVKGLMDGPPRFFQVTKNPIPDDARIVSVAASPAWSANGEHYFPLINITLESQSWSDADSEHHTEPELSVVDLPKFQQVPAYVFTETFGEYTRTLQFATHDELMTYVAEMDRKKGEVSA